MADQLKGQVTEIASSLTNDIASSFAGVMKAVIPDVTKPLAEAAENFQNQLVKGTGPKVEKAYVQLQSILKKFDVQISDLGKDFQKTSEAFEAIQKSRTIALEEVEKLRERNIVAEAQFIPNVKKNQMEYKAILLTDKQLMEKREQIIKDERKNKEKEEKLLAQLRQFQKRDDDNTKKKGESIIKQIQALQIEAKQIQEQKKLYSGKGGRFDTRVGGAIDNFERALQDKAPDFLVAALDPIVNFARQFQKTMSLVIDGFSFLKKSIKLLPDDFKKISSGFSQSFNLFKKNFLKGMGSVIKGLLTFDKRLIVTGFTMLSAIVAPLLPLIVPLLKLAAIVTGVVVAITLLKKGFDALTDWFRNSWLGKKIFGGDKGKGKEPQKEEDATQTKLKFLPIATSDFIFAFLVERYGFVGAIGLILLYLFLILHLFSINHFFRDDPILQVFAAGVALLIFLDMAVNILMVIGFAPVVGLPLPMFSYGGSSFINFMVLFAILQNLITFRFKHGYDFERRL